MILLDTDHITVLFFREHSQHTQLAGRILTATGNEFRIPIVSAEEQMRGWLARIHRLRTFHDQVPAYGELADLFQFLRVWEVVRFDRQAADTAERLRKQKVRIGTNDLKIAAIALAQNALLLSANLRDCRKVPGLRVENCLLTTAQPA